MGCRPRRSQRPTRGSTPTTLLFAKQNFGRLAKKSFVLPKIALMQLNLNDGLRTLSKDSRHLRLFPKLKIKIVLEKKKKTHREGLR